MAIAPNPKRPRTAATDQQAERFIDGASLPYDPIRAARGDALGQAALDAEKSRGRQPVMVRIPPDLLGKVDRAALRKGLSRSAYIVSTLADVVNGER